MAAGRRWSIAVALLVGFLGWLFFVSPLLEFGHPAAVAGLLVLGVIVTVYRRYRAGSCADDGSTVWDAIPDWQYTGRHVESGGLTRDDQEGALEAIEEEAERRRRP